MRKARQIPMLLCLLVWSCASSAPSQKVIADLARGGIKYWTEVRTTPRPLVLHMLKIDLAHKAVTLDVAVGKDPDGHGPAEAKLTLPAPLARANRLKVAVNANAFAVAANPDKPGWFLNRPVLISGLAADQGKLRSPASQHNVSFWIDASGTPHIGFPKPKDKPVEGCAGFGWLIQRGKVVGPDGPCHPRTALGLDKRKKTLTVVVVDGRQPGYSEGVTTLELARIMGELGCHDALNLDGGGSSIMLIKNRDGVLETINRPSHRIGNQSIPRPVPVMLGVRD